MAKIQIDEGELQMALSSGDGLQHWFLDRETGDVVFASDDAMWFSGADDEDDENDGLDADEDALPEDPEAMGRWVQRHPERFLEIPSMPSHDGFRMMERFTDSLEPGPARRALDEALQRRRPFRSFKDALASFPDIREAWFKYEERQLHQEAMDWLQSEGIDAELVPFVDRSQRGTPPE